MKKITINTGSNIGFDMANPDRHRAIERLKHHLKNKKNFSSLLPLLLAACGGGKPPPPPPPPPPPTPDFSESPTNTFTARDDNNRTLSEGNATADLIVFGKGGDDTITTGLGADLILGSGGADTISAGGGDDIIVLVGVTTANQYSESAITSPAGVGADLSALLTLADINGHSVSDVVSGETLDGGAGNNRLVIYGEVDISGITITNLTSIWVNSTLTLTTVQLNAMTSVTGDGSSVINVISNATAGTYEQVDLSTLSLSGIGTITSEGNVEILISDSSQLEGIGEIQISGSLIVTITAGAIINASDLAGTFAAGVHVEIDAGAMLILDSPEAVSSLGNAEFEGSGTLVVSDAVVATADSLAGITVDDDLVVEDAAGVAFNITELGGTIVPDIFEATLLELATPLGQNIAYSGEIDMFSVSLEADETYSVTIEPTIGSAVSNLYFTSVYAASGEAVAIAEYGEYTNSETENIIYLTAAESGTYYVSALTDDQSKGDYTVTFSHIDTTEPDGFADYGNSIDTADTFDIATTLSGTIAYEFDDDWLAVELVAGQTYSFTMSGDATGGNALAVADIYDIYDIYGFGYFGTEGENISVDGNDTLTFTAHYTGTFYLELTDGGSDASGDYTVSAIRAGIDEPDGTSDISADIDTTATIDVGTTVIGGTGMEYDRDWYAIEFVEGAVYELTLTGVASGTGTLIDPSIHQIYDANGVGIAGAFNDDGYGESRESYMLFTAPYTGTYYISAGGWDYEVGTYELSITDVSSTHTGDLPYGPTNAETFPNAEFVDISSDFRIDGLLAGYAYALDPDGTTTTITYSVPTSSDNYSERFYIDFSVDEPAEPWDEFLAMTYEQQVIYHSIFTDITSFTNITFTEVADVYGSAGTIRAAWTGVEGDTSSAWAYFPGTSPYSSDIWFIRDNMDETIADDYFQYVVMHEIGHALGLKHTFEFDEYAPAMPPQYDSHQWSVMAYDFNTDFAGANSADLYPQTFMYYDILALQYLYGAIETNTGDDTYVFDGNERYFMTIWDSGGNDTIEFVNQSGGIYFNLDNSQWQDVGTTINYNTDNGLETETYTVFVPEEVILENIYGSAYGDTIVANSSDNNIRGLGGNDSITAGLGVDVLDGGEGADTLTGGGGTDIFIIRSGDGGLAIADADMVPDYTDGEDIIGLNGLAYADLTIEAGIGDNAGDTVISITSTGEYLMVLDGVDISLVTSEDFAPIVDEWWLA